MNIEVIRLAGVDASAAFTTLQVLGPRGPAGNIGPQGPTGLVGPVGPAGAVNGEDSRLASAFVGNLPVATGSVSGAARFFLSTPATISGVIEKVHVAVDLAQSAEFYVCSVNPDGTLNLVASTALALTAGANTVAVDLPVSAGHVVGVLCPSGIYYTPDAATTPLWVTNGPVTTNTPKVVGGNHRLEFGVTVSGEVLGGVHVLRGRTASLESDFGQIEVLGVAPSAVAPVVASSGYAWILSIPATRAARIRKFQVASTVAQTAQVIVVAANPDGTVSLVSATPVEVAAGVTTVALDIPIAAGQYVGYFPPAGGLRYVAGSGLGGWLTAGLPATATPKTESGAGSWSLQLGFTLGTGVNGDVVWLTTRASAALAADPASLSVLSGNLPADTTAAFAAARQNHPMPYVPQGAFQVTSLPGSGNGFWGPGKVNLNGRRFLLPSAPGPSSLLLRLRSALASEIATAAPLVLIGDSISHGASATTRDKHWLSMLSSFANCEISPLDEPAITNLDPSGWPFFGLSASGTVSPGTSGPVGASLILAAGASLSFTGAYERVDVFYNQAPGAGTLSLSWNAAAPFKTINCAGTTDLDRTTGPSPTGQTASGIYAITAADGPVEITGLVRLGVKPAGTPPRLLTWRAARSGFTFPDYTTGRIASLMKQTAAVSTHKPFVVMALGTNDAFGALPAELETRVADLAGALKASGVTRLAAILPSRPSSAWVYPVGTSYDAALGALVRAYRQEEIAVLPVHAVDYIAEPLTSDGLHPNDAGNERMAQIIVEALAG